MSKSMFRSRAFSVLFDKTLCGACPSSDLFSNRTWARRHQNHATGCKESGCCYCWNVHDKQCGFVSGLDTTWRSTVVNAFWRAYCRCERLVSVDVGFCNSILEKVMMPQGMAVRNCLLHEPSGMTSTMSENQCTEAWETISGINVQRLGTQHGKVKKGKRSCYNRNKAGISHY